MIRYLMEVVMILHVLSQIHHYYIDYMMIKESKKINFNPSFKDKLYFVYLNKKQNSLDEIKRFKNIKNQNMYIEEISNITKIISCNNQIEFNSLIKEHEDIISKLTAREN